jgi:hypothetical protein
LHQFFKSLLIKFLCNRNDFNYKQLWNFGVSYTIIISTITLRENFFNNIYRKTIKMAII